jgi:hypothetical protein
MAIFTMKLRIVLSVLFLACGFAPLVFAVELAKPKTLFQRRGETMDRRR